ncbi:MAG TPA: helix-turn-helix domain-containing protein [Xanthobacteraceae bacterium]|nr:helix-turn-helix domain-containing protein [Xanthobacteraceae bacterium]
MMSRKQFNAARLALIDRLRRDHDKSPTARLIGAEIIASTNYVTGDAWPGGTHLQTKIGCCIRTVRRAIAELAVTENAPNNYLYITRGGRSNRYRPNLALLVKQPPPEGRTVAVATGDNSYPHRGHFCSRTGDNNAPLSLIENPFKSPARAAGADDERLTDRKGDEKAEQESVRLLGENGYAILSRLHEIDNGQPRLRLLALVRDGDVSELDLEAARLAAWVPISSRKD